MNDARYKILDTGYGMQDTGCRIRDAGYGIWDTGYGIFQKKSPGIEPGLKRIFQQRYFILLF